MFTAVSESMSIFSTVHNRAKEITKSTLINQLNTFFDSLVITACGIQPYVFFPIKTGLILDSVNFKTFNVIHFPTGPTVMLHYFKLK